MSIQDYQIENVGMRCYYSCGKELGPCKICGQIGLCCKEGLKEGKGCNGKIGGDTKLSRCVHPKDNTDSNGN